MSERPNKHAYCHQPDECEHQECEKKLAALERENEQMRRCGKETQDRWIKTEAQLATAVEVWTAMRKVLPVCPEDFNDGCPWHLMEEVLSQIKGAKG